MTNNNNINHLAIIMDGNGRWAEERRMNRLKGHRQGAESGKKIMIHASNIGIKHLSLFAFSSENWLRPRHEVEGLMSLLEQYISSELPLIIKHNIILKVIGDKEKLSKSLLQKIDNAEEKTKNNAGMKLYIALSYGGRNELLRAMNKMLQANPGITNFNEELLMQYMDAPQMPEVDLLIRTSGEQRISNFLLWKIAYAEMYFATKKWPDFGTQDLDLAISDFNLRKRKFGKIA